MNVGTVCMKIAGRDAGNLCVIVEEPKEGKALVEGAVRRRLVNLRHLEQVGKEVKVKKAASHEEVMKALGLEPRKRGTKERKPKEAAAPAEKPAGKTVKKKAAGKKAKKAVSAKKE